MNTEATTPLDRDLALNVTAPTERLTRTPSGALIDAQGRDVPEDDEARAVARVADEIFARYARPQAAEELADLAAAVRLICGAEAIRVAEASATRAREEAMVMRIDRLERLRAAAASAIQTPA